jgi:hypothetical protein
MLVFSLSVLPTGPIYSSVNTFFIKFKFLNGRSWNKSVKVCPLILLLSMSILLNFFLFFSTWIRFFAPSLSISLFDSYISSNVPQFAMNSQIFLHPTELILLLERLKTWRLCLFLFDNALITIAEPSSPILLPLKFNSLMVLLLVKQSSRALMPGIPISFFFRLKTSKYFLSFKDCPSATAPSANIPFD